MESDQQVPEGQEAPAPLRSPVRSSSSSASPENSPRGREGSASPRKDGDLDLDHDDKSEGGENRQAVRYKYVVMG